MLTELAAHEELRRSHRADVAAGVLAHAKRLRWSRERLDGRTPEETAGAV